MSYHGPRDNGEGRPGDIDTNHRETHVASSGATTTRSRSIPTPLRMAWDLENSDQEEEPEVTTSSDSPSILALLRRPRSRSPPPREPIHTASQPTTSRPLLFTPGLFGLQPPGWSSSDEYGISYLRCTTGCTSAFGSNPHSSNIGTSRGQVHHQWEICIICS